MDLALRVWQFRPVANRDTHHPDDDDNVLLRRGTRHRDNMHRNSQETAVHDQDHQAMEPSVNEKGPRTDPAHLESAKGKDENGAVTTEQDMTRTMSKREGHERNEGIWGSEEGADIEYATMVRCAIRFEAEMDGLTVSFAALVAGRGHHDCRDHLARHSEHPERVRIGEPRLSPRSCDLAEFSSQVGMPAGIILIAGLGAVATYTVSAVVSRKDASSRRPRATSSASSRRAIPGCTTLPTLARSVSIFFSLRPRSDGLHQVMFGQPGRWVLGIAQMGRSASRRSMLA